MYARYSAFKIGSMVEQYSLKKLVHYTGTADDSMSSHVGKKFTTRVRDDRARNCTGAASTILSCDPCASTNNNGAYLQIWPND